MDWSQKNRVILMVLFGILTLGLIAGGIVMFIQFPDSYIYGLLFLLGASICLFLSLFNMPIRVKEDKKYRD